MMIISTQLLLVMYLSQSGFKKALVAAAWTGAVLTTMLRFANLIGDTWFYASVYGLAIVVMLLLFVNLGEE